MRAGRRSLSRTRLATVQRADRILVVDSGRIAEQGSTQNCSSWAASIGSSLTSQFGGSTPHSNAALRAVPPAVEPLMRKETRDEPCC